MHINFQVNGTLVNDFAKKSENEEKKGFFFLSKSNATHIKKCKLAQEVKK